MSKTLIIKILTILLIPGIILTNIAWAQDFVYSLPNQACLSASIKISDQGIQAVFANSTLNLEETPALKEKAATFLNRNKYPALFSAILFYEAVNLITDMISQSYSDSFYASIFTLNLAAIALILSKSNLLAPESLVKVFPIEQIMDPEKILETCLIQDNQPKAAVAAEFLAQAKNSRFEWGLTIGKTSKKILNLISEGRSMEVRHSFWSHLVFSSKKIRTVSSLHTHPYEKPWTNINFFPSPNDFDRTNKLKREKNSENYLLVFPERDYPVLLKFHREPDGKNLVTHFVFGEKNVLIALTGIFAGKNFDTIQEENPEAITSVELEIIWKDHGPSQYSLNFSLAQTENAQVMALIKFNREKTLKSLGQTTAPRQSMPATHQNIQQALPGLSSLKSQSLPEQDAISFSI